ncbi:MAG: hypothetical protein HS113_03425 [Verrucomicrobiales bacterium]|nr:hypothetical protein [Verrucomicrobiales bacterium]
MKTSLLPSWLVVVVLVPAWGGSAGASEDSAAPSARWVLCYTSRDSEMYYALAFPDKAHGWIVGDAGRILHSRDAGSTWAVQPSLSTNRLKCVQFVSASLGWAAGENNTVVGTRDGGGTWSLVHPPGGPLRRTFMALHFVDEQEGWLGHNHGGLVHTRDGGRTWTARDGLAREALVAVWFLNAQRGWALGVNGALLRTEDGGQNWASQRLSTQPHAVASFSTLRFLDGSRGWLGTDAAISSRAGEMPPRFGTTDGGRTWSVEGHWPGTSVRAIWFGDAQLGWCAETGGLYATADGGRSWVRELNSGGDPVVAMVFADKSRGWALTFTGDVYCRNE